MSGAVRNGSKSLRVTTLNAVPALYRSVMELQEYLFARRKANTIDDTLLVLQHAPVYTMGKRGSRSDFKRTREELLEIVSEDVDIVTVPRGGETTYHGPGQIIAYPILNLRSLGLGARAYVESLEDAMIDTAASYGLQCRGRIPGKTGVWIGDRKIGAIGVAISGGVTRHGIAFNAAPDLSAFEHIVACGEAKTNATSLEKELNVGDIDLYAVARTLTMNIIQRIQHPGKIELVGDVFDLAHSKE